MEIIDVHTHAGRWMFSMRPHTFQELAAMERAAGIDVFVVSSAKAIVYDFVEGNAELAAALEGQPGAFGYVVVNPHYLELSLQELARYRHHPRFIGMKLHGDQQGFALEETAVGRLVEAAAQAGWPVLVHTFSVATALQLRELARRFAGHPFIMAHMGGAQWRAAIPVVAEMANVYLDPCSSYPHAGKIEAAVAAVGPERVLFGSDASLFDPWFVRGVVESANLDAAVRRRIYRDNALAVFGKQLGGDGSAAGQAPTSDPDEGRS